MCVQKSVDLATRSLLRILHSAIYETLTKGIHHTKKRIEREMSNFAENANFARRKFYKADCFQQEIRALMEKVVKHFLFFFPLDLGTSSILRFTRL